MYLIHPDTARHIVSLEHEHRLKRADRTHRLGATPRRAGFRAGGAVLGALLLTSACATGAVGRSDSAPAEVATTTVAVAHDDHPVVVIRGNDYSFDDVPETVPAGTQLGLRNESSTELHELVVFRLPDDEQRSSTELVFLPRSELETLLGTPVTVLLQAPGEEVITALGDGTLQEPGRYVLLCFVPVGADPAEYLAAVAEGGPPPITPGSEHFVQGMYAELDVTST